MLFWDQWQEKFYRWGAGRLKTRSRAAIRDVRWCDVYLGHSSQSFRSHLFLFGAHCGSLQDVLITRNLCLLYINFITVTKGYDYLKNEFIRLRWEPAGSSEQRLNLENGKKGGERVLYNNCNVYTYINMRKQTDRQTRRLSFAFTCVQTLRLHFLVWHMHSFLMTHRVYICSSNIPQQKADILWNVLHVPVCLPQ